MHQEKYAIYCFNLEKTICSHVRYPKDDPITLEKLLNFGAWSSKISEEGKWSPPQDIPKMPDDFDLKVLSYSDYKEINTNQKIDDCRDNVFVVLLPEFQNECDLKNLEVVLDARFRNWFRKENIQIINEDVKEDIFDVKPNIAGFGVNFNAMYRAFKKWRGQP